MLGSLKELDVISADVDMAVADGAESSTLSKIEAEWPHVSALLCAAHSTALIFKNIIKTDSVTGMVKDIKKIVTFFRAHDATNAMLPSLVAKS